MAAVAPPAGRVIPIINQYFGFIIIGLWLLIVMIELFMLGVNYSFY